MKSCIYEGRVSHRRRMPVQHEFQYRLFMLYLDLDELEEVFLGRWLWAVDRPAFARFRRADHLGDPEEPLGHSVRNLVEQETGHRPRGPIRLLTQLSYLGYGFSPVSFYYCFDREDQRVETIVTEVNNTPWGEQHCYVLSDRSNLGNDKVRRFKLDKDFHVSPFMEMSLNYDWRFTDPGDELVVHMVNRKNDAKLFDATLRLERVELNGYALARVLTVYPLITIRIIMGIYWQALRLWIKRCPVFDHPSKAQPVSVKR